MNRRGSGQRTKERGQSTDGRCWFLLGVYRKNRKAKGEASCGGFAFRFFIRASWRLDIRSFQRSDWTKLRMSKCWGKKNQRKPPAPPIRRRNSSSLLPCAMGTILDRKLHAANDTDERSFGILPWVISVRQLVFPNILLCASKLKTWSFHNFPTIYRSTSGDE